MKRKIISALLLTTGFLVNLDGSNVRAQEPCPGVLTINEFSNGANGAKEFVELLAASCDECSESENRVNISNWIIDDNNGIFTSDPAVASGNLGISGGHLKLTNDSLWTNFANGTLLVLFNAADFDSANADFMSASTQDYYVSGTGAVFVAVGFSTLVEVKTTTPIVGVSSSIDYCDATLYGLSGSAWNMIGLRNSKLGDGIQVRCPGCNPNEPDFYHGVSYGDTTMHVTNTNPAFFDGAHIAFDPMDTIGGTGRSFIFYQGSDPGIDSDWMFVSHTLATPGSGNTPDNQTYLNDVASGRHTFNCCRIEEPVDTTAEGVLIVTEISNGPSGSCEYVELLVAACDGVQTDSVDIRGWIIDDNSGNFNTTGCTTGVGISNGHLRFANNSCWEKVPVGAVIVLFNTADNCYNFVDDACDSNSDGIYYIAVGTNANIEVTTSKPSSTNCLYCPSIYSSPVTTSWGTTVALGNSKDAIQVRCPGCTQDNPTTEPEFYHGIGYGSGFSGIVMGSNDLGGAYVSGTGTGKKYEFFQGNAPGSDANWQSSTADVAGTPPASVGNVFAFRDSVIAGVYTFPCCDNSAGLKSQGANTPETTVSSSRNEIVVYPNPANDVVSFNMDMNSDFQIQIVDLTGKIVYSSNHVATDGATTTQVNISGIASGTYTYLIISTETAGTTQSGILIIERN